MTSLPPNPPGPPPPEVPAELPAEAAEDAAPHAAPNTAPDAAAPERRRPRGRTSLIIASAALLGIVAGLGTGYTVQADRKPTPLPPLSQAELSYPDKPLPEDEYEPIPAKHDRRVKTDGDLRKLLVDKPKGARETVLDRSPDGWVPLSTYAREYTEVRRMFRYTVAQDIRRVAGVEWQSGRQELTTVRLVQFHDLTARSAAEHARSQQNYMSMEDWAASDGRPLKGSGNGLYWIDEAPDRKPGYLPYYSNRAIAWRGDIMMDIEIDSARPVSEKAIRELAERQLERL